MDTQNTLFTRLQLAARQPASRLAFTSVLGVVALMAGLAMPFLGLERPAPPTALAGKLDLATLPAPSGPLTATSTVEEVAAKLLVTNRAYRHLSAHLTSTLGDGRLVTDATLAIEQPARFRIEASDGQLQWKAISDGDEIWVHYPSGKVQAHKNTGKLASPVMSSDPRPDHVIVPESGTDLPIGGMADTMIHPHSVVQGVFPNAEVKITGTERVGGREGVIVEVRPSSAKPTAWAPKWGSSRVYVVDAQTGILLRAEQFRTDGALMTRDVLSDIKVDDPAFAADFHLQLAPGERLTDPGEEP